MEARVGGRGMKNDGKEAEPFLSLAAALDGSQAWLGSWEPWRECWALERLGVWVTGGPAGSWWGRQKETWLLVSAVPVCDLVGAAWPLLLPINQT